MIRRVRLGSFKRFRDQSFELGRLDCSAGPNNAGKSTLLQASRPGSSVSTTGSLSARGWQQGCQADGRGAHQEGASRPCRYAR